MANELYPCFASVFTQHACDAVLSAPQTHKAHPLARLVRHVQSAPTGAPSDVGKTVATVERALKYVSATPALGSWLRRITADAVQTTDYANASGALAELRALGTLLEMGLHAEPIPRSAKHGQKTADFHVKAPFDAIIEVHCKQMHGPESQSVARILQEPMPKPGPDGIAFRAFNVRPVGGSDDETNVENLAQKFAQIKPKSAQAVTGSMNLIWIDLQDEDMWTVDARHTSPIASFQQRFYSGGLWLAFYGKRGTALLEHDYLEGVQSEGPRAKLRFDGRFHRPDDMFDAAILFFPGDLVFFQRPERGGVAEQWIAPLMRAAWFRYERSWMDWPPSDSLAQRVDNELRRMNSLAERIGSGRTEL